MASSVDTANLLKGYLATHWIRGPVLSSIKGQTIFLGHHCLSWGLSQLPQDAWHVNEILYPRRTWSKLPQASKMMAHPCIDHDLSPKTSQPAMHSQDYRHLLFIYVLNQTVFPSHYSRTMETHDSWLHHCRVFLSNLPRYSTKYVALNPTVPDPLPKIPIHSGISKPIKDHMHVNLSIIFRWAL